MVLFTQKFTGAKARLFAAMCYDHFMDQKDSGNRGGEDPVITIPIFSWLSPQQRLKLIRDLIVGLLCPNEPLPPSTIQHFAAYEALVSLLKAGMDCEIVDVPWHGDVGKDLLVGHDHVSRVGVFVPNYVKWSPEEKAQKERDFELIRLQAEKNKRKIVDHQQTNENPTLAFKVKEKEPGSEEVYAHYQKLIEILFDGPSITPLARQSLRVPEPGSDEEFSFKWRRLCDAAFQEEVDSFFPIPLCNVDFDWRSRNEVKWNAAIDGLFRSKAVSGVQSTREERALVHGMLEETSYVDPTQFARIRAVEQQVKLLRATHDTHWNPDESLTDMHCIFALVSEEELIYRPNGYKWQIDFIANCKEHGIEFVEPGNYQQKFDIFQSMEPPIDREMLAMFDAPSDYKSEEAFSITCNGPGCYCSDKESLMKCSRCKVVRYCSRECQQKHWVQGHKQQCKEMAKLRKDKEKIMEMAQNYY
jgi:hypothetical protein